MLPSPEVLKQINQQIKHIPNQRKESKRKIHYGCYLLCYNSGLRVSEALKFDLSARTKKGLYRLEKPKGKKKRYVYIPKKIINELKKSKWKPKQTNRFNFYHFLRKIKRELNISGSVELTPHTLRRAFTTYHAENGLPLPLLQKLLGHASIRTTALYWQNIYNDENGDDPNDILTGKNWLEKSKKPQPEPEIVQNHTNLINAYQITFKDKEITQKQLNNIIQEVKKAAQQFYQWQKLNYYQQLEKQNRMEAKIVQREPPPFKLQK